jgi:hypothetical protein
MILLSSLLGPAKPPVATQADVSSAGGLFRLVEYAGSLVAEALEGEQTINLGETERCLICLSDYEAAEEVRQLTKCKHLYHKECIDQVCFYRILHFLNTDLLIFRLVVDYRTKFLPPLPGSRSY